MREGWTYKKLGEIATIIGGSTPKTNIKEFWDGDNLWVTPAELDGSKYIYNTQRCITDFAVAKTNLTLLPMGTVLLSSRAPIGKVCITKKPMYCNQGFKNIVCKESLFNEFVYYYLKNNIDYLQSLGTGATFKEISKKVVEKIRIPVPPLPEQERIVSELDLLSGIIEKKKAQLQEYDQLAQSIFYDMFGDPVENEKGWEVKKLLDNVHEMFLGPFGSALKVDSYVSKEDSYCMVYEQKHAIQGTINLDNHYINKDKFDTLQRFEVKPHDFIMSCRGTIGKLYQLPNNAPNGIIHPSLMKIRIKEDVYNSTYFQFMLVKIVANESTNGNCVQMAITAKELGKKELPVPPLTLQQSFASKIEAIEQQKELIKQSISETETLFNSRMDYWFN